MCHFGNSKRQRTIVSIGCGMAFTVENKTRNRIDEDKLEHY
jgi:hypothetical protein